MSGIEFWLSLWNPKQKYSVDTFYLFHVLQDCTHLKFTQSKLRISNMPFSFHTKLLSCKNFLYTYCLKTKFENDFCISVGINHLLDFSSFHMGPWINFFIISSQHKIRLTWVKFYTSRRSVFLCWHVLAGEEVKPRRVCKTAHQTSGQSWVSPSQQSNTNSPGPIFSWLVLGNS